MIQRQLKLKLTKKQEKQLDAWLPTLTAIWNWGLRKIELNAKDGVYFSKFDLIYQIKGHSQKLKIPSNIIHGLLYNIHDAWLMCFKKISNKPKLKGHRNKLNSIPFTSNIRVMEKRIKIYGIKTLIKYHKQDIPEGNIKCGRIIKKVSGWYLNLTIDCKSKEINKVSHNQIGIDPGYQNLLTLSNGEKIEHPKELQKKLKRIGQAQRGRRKHLTARLHERTANQKKDRNHKLSRRLVAENDLIAISKDNIGSISKLGFGKSVQSANHGQLRKMLLYKSSNSGTTYIEVPSRNSTRTCSACGSLTGPQGRAGLKVRQWVCSACGANHDRDVNAAINTLKAALGSSVEGCVKQRQESKGN